MMQVIGNEAEGGDYRTGIQVNSNGNGKYNAYNNSA
jgi:hypothetical protein